MSLPPSRSPHAASLLEAADHVNATPGARFAARGAALLARQAIEASLDDFWRVRALGVQECSMRAQLICAPFYLPDDIAHGVNHTWWALTRVCHHHAYDLAPTPQELDDLLLAARDLVTELQRRSGGGHTTN